MTIANQMNVLNFDVSNVGVKELIESHSVCLSNEYFNDQQELMIFAMSVRKKKLIKSSRL